jgi:hypothetical protein
MSRSFLGLFAAQPQKERGVWNIFGNRVFEFLRYS